MTLPVDDLGRQSVRSEVPPPVRSAPPLRPARPGSRSGVQAAPAAVQRRGGRNWSSNATLLTAVTVIISLGNYSYSFLVLHLMGARAFSRFSAAQGLLLVIGSGGMAAIPWAGTATQPRAKLRHTREKKRLEVSSSASQNTPARNGRTKRSTISCDRCHRASSAAAVRSGPVRSRAGAAAA